jgi:hypothetical protein
MPDADGSPSCRLAGNIRICRFECVDCSRIWLSPPGAVVHDGIEFVVAVGGRVG